MRLRPALLLAVLFGAALLYCRYVEYERYLADERYVTPPESAKSPVTVSLAWDNDPGPDRLVTLTAQVTSRIPADQVSLRWVLPAEVTPSGTYDELLGPIAAGQVLTATRRATLGQDGVHKLVAGAHIELPGPSVFGGSDVVYAVVGPGESAYLTREGPRLPSAEETVETPELRISEAPGPDGGFWVRGRFMYEDIPVTTAGAGTPALRPARGMLVEVWEEDPFFDDLDGTTRTDDDGYFEVRVRNNDDGWFGGDKETFVRVYAQNAAADVTDRSGTDQQYVVRTHTVTGGHDIDFGTMTPDEFDPMYNIADAALDANRYAAQFRDAPKRLRIQYEPGYGESSSFYDSYWDEITLNDVDDDAYDDAIIMHEYGHFIAHHYACDDSPGGPHNLHDHKSSTLAWSEGWGNYLSSAIRQDPWYLDWDWGASGWYTIWNLETFADEVGSDNEGAVAGILWDIYDRAQEPHDYLGMDDEEIWEVIDDGMEVSYYKCNLHGFYNTWVDRGQYSDSAFAAIFAHYAIDYTDRAGAAALPVGPATPGSLALLETIGAIEMPDPDTAPDTIFVDEVPWAGVLFLVDRTQSMSNEIAAVKLIIQQRVVDLDNEPTACEYAVETFGDTWDNTPVVDDFFPSAVNPAVQAITVSGGGDIAEGSLHALVHATRYRQGFNAWLFTDGPSKELLWGREGSVPEGNDAASLGWVNLLVKQLQKHRVTPYIFVFGQCDQANTPKDGGEAMDLQSCIEPYLQTAAGTGGQFMFLDSTQLASATEIVRGLMKDNAGAGRFNYTVNATDWTYSWDDVPFAWSDAASIGGTFRNIGDTPAQVSLPWFFTFHGQQYNRIYVHRPGYITFGNQTTNQSHTSIPTAAVPNNAVYGFWSALDNRPNEAANPDAMMGVYTYWDSINDRFIVEYHQNYHLGDPLVTETFQIVLERNTATGDTVRVQYKEVGDDSAMTLGVENAAGTVGTRVAFDDPGFLYNGRALRFSPIAPGPRDHVVPVDSYVEDVSFFLNGYLGSVSLAIYRPNGAPVGTGDPDVTYYAVGTSKYYRITNPASGNWTARVAGTGTYYFNVSMKTDLVAQYAGEHTMTLGANQITMDLGRTFPTAPAFALVNSQGATVANLTLYDDGAHGDGAPGDGNWGGTHTATASGSYYLQVSGVTSAGVPFRRVDPVPLTFQAMRLTGSANLRYAQPGDTKTYYFNLRNSDTLTRTFDVLIESQLGWITPQYRTVTVEPGGFRLVQVTVHVPSGAPNTTDTLQMTADSAGMAATATYMTTVRRAAGRVQMTMNPYILEPDGDQAVVTAQAYDALGWDMPDGTPVTFQTDLGTVSPATAPTAGGLVTTTLTTGSATGFAHVQATAGAATGVITVEIRPSPPYSITLSAAVLQLPPNGAATTTLAAHVCDRHGQPVTDGTTVVFGVEGDEMIMGSIAGQEVYTTTTTSGVATATFRSGLVRGDASVRAYVPSSGATGPNAGLSAWVTIRIAYLHEIMLPAVLRNAP